MSVPQPQGSIRGNDGDADVISPRMALRVLKEMLSVNGALQLDIHGLVSCFFPLETPRDIDSWIGDAVKS